MNSYKHYAIKPLCDLEHGVLLKLASTTYVFVFTSYSIFKKSSECVMVFQPISIFLRNMLLLITSANEMAAVLFMVKLFSFNSLKCWYFDRASKSCSVSYVPDFVSVNFKTLIFFMPGSNFRGKNLINYLVALSLT